jgi:multidrug resistance efflux pump
VRDLSWLSARWRWIAGALVLAALLVMVLQAALRGDATVPRETERTEAARTVGAPAADQRARLPPPGEWVSGNGIVEPIGRERAIEADASGVIRAIPVEEGQRVEAGDLLVQLDDATERAALAAAEAEVKAARATLSLRVRGSRPEEVEEARQSAKEAEAQAESSADTYRRLKAVASAGGVSEERVEQARRQAEADRARAQAAAARRSKTIAGTRREEIAEARAALAAAEARVDEAHAALAKRQVRAPIAGEVLQIGRRVGEYHQPGGDPLLWMGDTSTLRVRAEIYERDIGGIRLGAEAFVRADAYPGVDFRARVVEIGDRIGPKRIATQDPSERADVRVLEVVLELDEARGLIVGQRVVAYLASGPEEQALNRGAVRLRSASPTSGRAHARPARAWRTASE